MASPSSSKPTQPIASVDQPANSTRYAWFVLALLFCASFSNYFDRQTLSVLKTTLKSEFHLDDARYALLVNVFTGCYAVSYVVSGWIVDRFGPRRSLTSFIVLWSMITIGCGIAHRFWEMVLLRGLLGLAEPGLHPVTIRAATVWVSDKGRGLFITLATSGSSVATIVSVPIIAWLAIAYHWRIAFVLPGILGLGVGVLWWKNYYEPQASLENQARAKAEGRVVRPAMPWTQLFRQKAMWGIILSRLVSDPVVYFCVFWMPSYLQENKGISLTKLGMVGWIPFLAGQLGAMGFVALSDFRARKAGFYGRKQLAIMSALLGPSCLLIPGATNLSLTITLFCILSVVYNCWMGSLAPMITEIFPVGNVASIWGIAGAFGAVGAIIFNMSISHAVQLIGANALFVIMACLHPLAAVILHILVKPTQPDYAKTDLSITP